MLSGIQVNIDAGHSPEADQANRVVRTVQFVPKEIQGPGCWCHERPLLGFRGIEAANIVEFPANSCLYKKAHLSREMKATSRRIHRDSV
jgi:hypothetical protein